MRPELDLDVYVADAVRDYGTEAPPKLVREIFLAGATAYSTVLDVLRKMEPQMGETLAELERAALEKRLRLAGDTVTAKNGVIAHEHLPDACPVCGGGMCAMCEKPLTDGEISVECMCGR
jgi:hypothetical protein